jgi:hypothetical protein
MKIFTILVAAITLSFAAKAQTAGFGVKNRTNCDNYQVRVCYVCSDTAKHYTAWTVVPSVGGAYVGNSGFTSCPNAWSASKVELRAGSESVVLDANSPTSAHSSTLPCSSGSPAFLRMQSNKAAEISQ